jgi:hypothetical protein
MPPSTPWSYTGVTRGKRLVVLVGQKKAIAIAVRNVSGRHSWSKLSEWLRMSSHGRSAGPSITVAEEASASGAEVASYARPALPVIQAKSFFS